MVPTSGYILQSMVVANPPVQFTIVQQSACPEANTDGIIVLILNPFASPMTFGQSEETPRAILSSKFMSFYVLGRESNLCLWNSVLIGYFVPLLSHFWKKRKEYS